MQDADPDLLTIPETAKYMGSSRQHVYNLINAGELEFVNVAVRKTGRTKKRIHKAAIDAFNASRAKRHPRRRARATAA